MTKKGYKLETWKIKRWKNTKREDLHQQKRLVKRDEKGHFISSIPTITRTVDKQGKIHEKHTIQRKVYGSGVYLVGLKNGKIVTRKLIARKNVEWYEARKEGIAKHQMFRSSYVLNNVPISKNGYFGFRIVCFSRNKDQLSNLKSQMKQKLIKWIEECTRYSEDEFWFDMYFGYEAPTPQNAFKTENQKYYLTQENTKGVIMKEKQGSLGTL